jgi:hypothetical protein
MLRNTEAITTFEERVHVENEVINGFESMGAIPRNHVREAAVVRDKFKKILCFSTRGNSMSMAVAVHSEG